MTAAGIEEDLNDLAFVGTHTVEMLFLPTAWAVATHSPKVWAEVVFPPVERGDIPKEPGVYAFVVKTELFDFPFAGGLFYVGKATNLYERIGAYIGEQTKRLNESTRPFVWKMINRWRGHLRYLYTITADVAAAETLENEMLNAFRPPFNKRYEATVSQTMRAF
jgi:hypothetical protein